MFQKNDFLFFYFLHLIRSNMKVMSSIRKYITVRKHCCFSCLDALLIYYYVMIGLQCDFALRFIEYYIKSNDHMRPYRILTPLLKN